MTVSNVWVGATTDTTATVTAAATGASVRFLVAKDVDLTDPVAFGPVTPVAGRIRVTAEGLDPDTAHFYALEEDSVVDTVWTGRFRTHPPAGEPAAFTVAFGSCAGLANGETDEVITSEVSNHPVFDTIRDADPLLFIHEGDMHYRNIAVDDADLYRQAYSDVFTYNGTLGANALQGLLYREVATAYMWDDHDYGPNNSDGTDAGRDAARTVYREVVPHYPLPSNGPVYQAFTIGRVLFVLSDTRSERSPNSTADTTSKTMLGAEQKAWFRTLLETTDAKFLAWMTPTPWWAYSGDSWEGFNTERQELLAMFIETGWDQKMIACFGDRHTMGIATGDANPHGDFPLFLSSGLDSHTTEVPDERYDAGALQARGGWMTLDFSDVGEQISVTATIRVNGYSGATYTYRVNVDSGGEDVVLPAPVEAREKTEVTWLACDAVTGRIIDELPDLTGRISRLLGDYTSSTFKTPIVSSGRASRRNLLQSTAVADVMLCAVINNVPAWAGTILRRTRGTGGLLDLAAVSLEGYLQRRYIRAAGPFVAADAGRIARALLGNAGDIAGVGAGLGLLLDVELDTGLLLDRIYLPTDRKTVYEGLTELMTLDGGPEWTIDPVWASDRQNQVAKIARVRSRIGVTAVSPHAVFESVGPAEATYTYTEDFTDGAGANYVVAYSSGQGDSQPASDPQLDTTALTLGRAIYEHPFQPDTSMQDTADLNAHASAELARVRNGTRTINLTARWNTRPRLNLDWALGDDVAWLVHGPGDPDGLAGKGRTVGWDLDLQAGTVDLTVVEEAPSVEVRAALLQG